MYLEADKLYQGNEQLNMYFFFHNIYYTISWDEVLPHMSKGEKARIIVPPALAYGDRGYPPIIPPNAKVIYEIELLSISSARFYEKTKN